MQSLQKRWNKLQPVFQAALNVTKFRSTKLYATAYILIDQKDNTGYFCKKCQIPESFLLNHRRFINFDYGMSYVITSTYNNLIILEKVLHVLFLYS